MKFLFIFFLSILNIGFVSAEEVDNKFNYVFVDFKRNVFFDDINKIKKEADDQFIPIAVSMLYRNDYPLNENDVDYIKINFSNFIVQKYKNGLYKDKRVISGIYSLTKSLVGSQDAAVRRDAIALLGYFDMEESFKILIKVVDGNDESDIPATLYSIFMLCDSYNDERYAKAEQALNSRNKKIAMNIKNDVYYPLRKSGWCDRTITSRDLSKEKKIK